MSSLTKVRHIFPRDVKIKFVFLFIGILAGAQIETLTLSVIQPFILILTDPTVIYDNQIIYFVYSLFGFREVVTFLAFLAVMVATVYAFRGLYVYFFTRIQNRFIATNTATMSNRLLTQTLRQPYLYHVNHNALELQRVVTQNSTRLFGMVSSVILLLSDGFMSLFMLAFLMVTSFSMTLVVLFLASICIIAYFRIFKSRIQASGEDEAKGIVMINKSLLQALHGIKEIKITQRESYFINRFKTIRINTIKLAERILTLRQLPKLFIESLCFSGAFLVVALIIMSGVDLQALVPQLGIFMLAAFKLLPAISRLVNNVTQFLRQKPAIDLVYNKLFESDEEFSQLLLPEPEIQVVSNDIIVTNVKFKYVGARRQILKNVSLVIPCNKSVAIIGPSGAGKSTLVDIILGILPPSGGSVAFKGKSVHHNFSSWAKNVGYIPQVIYLLDETLLENIAFGVDKSNIDEKKVWRALEQAQLKDFVKSLPDGLQTKVGERGARLSGGQRQRIGIARALYDDPDILVLDEATSALDNDTEKAVMDAIRGLHGSKTMIIVAHRLSTIEHCDIVYRVDKRTVTQIR